MKELLITSLLGLAVLGLDILKLRKLIFPVILLALLGLLACVGMDWGHNENPFTNNMLLFDNFALGFTAVLTLLTFFWFLLTRDYFATHKGQVDMYSLALFSLCGAVVLTAYTNLVMLFLGIEILSIPLYVLAASKKGDEKSNEAGFKYFFLGSLASAILLFGIALVYGSTGTFDTNVLQAALEDLGQMPHQMLIGAIMIFIGFAFKVSAAPFHFWAPDVYQGTPTPITALMATVVKGAAFAALLRLFGGALLSALDTMSGVIAFVAVLTLIVANTIAAVQTNSKRLLAYSSISHAGFMLGAVLTANSTNPKVMIYYVLAYGIASLTSFSILHHVSQSQNDAEEMDIFKGLVKRNPVMAGAMTLSLLSMAGIPPLSGFLAKYFVITDVMAAGHTGLVIIMILSSVIGVYYYLKVIVAMFTPLENAGRIVVSSTQQFVLILLSVFMIGLFFAAGLVEILF